MKEFKQLRSTCHSGSSEEVSEMYEARSEVYRFLAGSEAKQRSALHLHVELKPQSGTWRRKEVTRGRGALMKLIRDEKCSGCSGISGGILKVPLGSPVSSLGGGLPSPNLHLN